MNTELLDELIVKERHRRQRLVRQQRPMYWWQEKNQFPPPEKDVWCDYCLAYYGVPHTNMHVEGQYCKFISRALNSDRQCACLDCVCAEKIGGENSLASRITHA